MNNRAEEFRGSHWRWQRSGRETHAWHPRVWPPKTRVCNYATALKPNRVNREKTDWHGDCYGWRTRSRWCRRHLCRDSLESLGNLAGTRAQCDLQCEYRKPNKSRIFSSNNRFFEISLSHLKPYSIFRCSTLKSYNFLDKNLSRRKFCHLFVLSKFKISLFKFSICYLW